MSSTSGKSRLNLLCTKPSCVSRWTTLGSSGATYSMSYWPLSSPTTCAFMSGIVRVTTRFIGGGPPKYLSLAVMIASCFGTPLSN